MTVRWLTPADESAWDEALPQAQSAFGGIGFARLQEATGMAAARLLVVGEGPSRIAYPLLMRSLDELPFALPDGLGDARWDAASPPYTGPMVAAGADPERTAPLADEIARALAEAGVISEFAHLHPWRSRPELAGGGTFDREIVWIDASLDDGRLLAESFSHACRKNVRRAERAGVTVRVARGDADLAEFHRIYLATMDRNEALAAYRFPISFFQSLAREMNGHCRFVLAEHEGSVIAGTLYLHDDDVVYSYLGGADHAYQELRPSNAVIYETARWARGAGKRRVVLGGGYRPDDGIMRFKASFSPLRAKLELARRIHREEAYGRLTQAWREHYRDRGEGVSFFPLHRAPAPGGE